MPEQRKKLENEIKRRKDKLQGIVKPKEKYHNINLKLNVPSGKLSDIVRIVNYIKSKFNQVNIKVEISAQDGKMTLSEYEDKIKEAINQAGVSIKGEDVE